jgi:hypothetical protein
MRIRLLLASVLLLALAAPAAADSHTASLTVIHGVPDATVDVWVNGEATLTGFAPGTITDPLELPAGDYEIEVYAAGDDPEEADAIISASVTLPAGANASGVAHLSADGTPTLTAFVNDTSALAAGEARLTVRHTAAAPAVDVRAGGEPVFTNLANPDEASADLPAGTVSADVVLAGESDPVLGPADVPLAAGTSTVVYAIGSAEDGSLDLLVQSISGLGDTPGAIHSGTGGQAATSSLPLWAVAAALLGAAVMLSTGVALARSRA